MQRREVLKVLGGALLGSSPLWTGGCSQADADYPSGNWVVRAPQLGDEEQLVLLLSPA